MTQLFQNFKDKYTIRVMNHEIKKFVARTTPKERKAIVPKLKDFREEWADSVSGDILDILDKTIERFEKGEE